MADVSSFESRSARIDREIEDGIVAIRKEAKLALPAPEAGIVKSYVQKIQGVCDVGKARKDTDDALDLLHIAYNATPQENGDVRNSIVAVTDKLILAQQKNEMAMRSAMQVATRINKQMEDIFPDWLDVEEGEDQAEIEDFIAKDFQKLVRSVEGRAAEVREQFLSLAASYDEILEAAAKATAEGEAALSARLADKRAAEEDIEEAQAKRERLESLAKDLAAEADAFERMARDCERRAATAEERALVTSIVRIGAQVISSAAPAIAMARGGPAGLPASSDPDATVGAGSGGREDGGAKPQPGHPGGDTPGNTSGPSPEGQRWAADLREVQARLIDKAERYETQRREQSAELAKVAALLKGERTEGETIELALRCLHVSLDALGRLKETAQDVALLSRSLAGSDAGDPTGIDGEAGRARTAASVDEFFIRQAARWHAAAVVLKDFGMLFAEGWSKLNKLSGDYVTGDRLGAYLEEASAKLTAIVAEREKTADRRIASLQDRRKGLSRDG